jgi:hypothetical protein
MSNPTGYTLRIGSIKQRAQFHPPKRQIWCKSALPWSMDITGAEKHERQ